MNNGFVNEADAIFNLQKYLRQLSYFDPDIPAVPVDGVFDSDTEKAIMSFQRKYGLSETGSADKATWDLIFLKYLESLDDNAVPSMIAPFPRIPNGYALTLGDRWFLVEILQYMLEELKSRYDGFEPISRTGIYDKPTESAIKDFQMRNSLPVTGNTDVLTWNSIANQYNFISRDYKQ